MATGGSGLALEITRILRFRRKNSALPCAKSKIMKLIVANCLASCAGVGWSSPYGHGLAPFSASAPPQQAGLPRGLRVRGSPGPHRGRNGVARVWLSKEMLRLAMQHPVDLRQGKEPAGPDFRMRLRKHRLVDASTCATAVRLPSQTAALPVLMSANVGSCEPVSCRFPLDAANCWSFPIRILIFPANDEGCGK